MNLEQIVIERIKELNVELEKEQWDRRKRFIESLIWLNLEIKKRIDYDKDSGLIH
jgi:hypothetical protein